MTFQVPRPSHIPAASLHSLLVTLSPRHTLSHHHTLSLPHPLTLSHRHTLPLSHNLNSLIITLSSRHTLAHHHALPHNHPTILIPFPLPPPPLFVTALGRPTLSLLSAWWAPGEYKGCCAGGGGVDKGSLFYGSSGRSPIRSRGRFPAWGLGSLNKIP